MDNPKLTIHKSTVINLYRELEHIKDLVDEYSSEFYDPKKLYDEMVDVVFGYNNNYKDLMDDLQITLNGKEVK